MLRDYILFLLIFDLKKKKDLGLISPSRVIPKDLKKWFSQLPCLTLSTKRNTVEIKPASLPIKPLGKTLKEMPPSLYWSYEILKLHVASLFLKV